MAAWDLHARQLGVAALRACSAARGSRSPSGVSIGIQDSVDELVERVDRELAAGYQPVKIKIKPGWDVDAVERVRGAFRPDPADGRRQRRVSRWTTRRTWPRSTRSA